MKLKMFISALMVAAFAALGMSRGALALSASADGTSTSDPECTPLSTNTSHKIVLCTDSVTVEVKKYSGVKVTVEAVAPDTTLPSAPGVNFLGPATIIKVVDAEGKPVKAAFMQICFKDATKANVFRWWTPADLQTWFNAKNAKAHWVYTPTVHTATGMTCTVNWLPGTFTIN